jgi:hypothetical protein
MKTAMQELIDDLKELKKDSKERNKDTSFDIGMTFAIARAELRLEKEKDRMFHAFYAGVGYDEVLDDCDKIFEQYYNEVFNQNK